MMFGRKMLLKTFLCSAILSAALNVFAANSKRSEPGFMANVELYMSDQNLAEPIQVDKKCAGSVCMQSRLDIKAFIQNSRCVDHLASNAVTLYFIGHLLHHAENIRCIDQGDRKKIAKISLDKHGAEDLSESSFEETIIDLFPQLEVIEIRAIESDILQYLLSNKVIVCTYIDIPAFKGKNSDRKPSLVQLGGSNVRVIFKKKANAGF